MTATPGLPQKRERVFFYAIRKDLDFETTDLFGERPYLDLEFNEEPIPFKNVKEKGVEDCYLSAYYTELWKERIEKDLDFSCINGRVRGKPNTGFGTTFVKDKNVCGTLTSKKDCYCVFDEGRYLSKKERCLVGSYPLDYNFHNTTAHYLIGMSVPPLMTAKIAQRVQEAWL